MRVTLIACANSTWHSPTRPVTGEAADGSGVAAERERRFRRLNSGLEPDHITDVLLKTLVYGDQKVVGMLPRFVYGFEIFRELRTGGFGLKVRREVALQRGFVLKREMFGRRL